MKINGTHKQGTRGKQLFFGGSALEKRKPEQKKYYNGDHLGNTRVTYTPTASCTNAGNNLSLQSMDYELDNVVDYYPYGKVLRQFSTANEKYLFTGKERDVETGLDYHGARYRDSEVVPFLSLDPLQANFPAWSPYSYVLGNPVNLIDPDGKAPVPGDDKKTANNPNSSTTIHQQRIAEGGTPQASSAPSLVPYDRNASGSDYQGFIRNATPEQREQAPVFSAVVDASADIANGLGVGGVDNAIATYTAPNATSSQVVDATINLATAGAFAGKGGRLSNKLTPNLNASGAHTTFKTNPQTGKITGYATWTPNAKNPTGFDLQQRTDVTGGSHINKVTNKEVPTPHTQGKDIPGGVRPAKPDEIPNQ